MFFKKEKKIVSVVLVLAFISKKKKKHIFFITEDFIYCISLMYALFLNTWVPGVKACFLCGTSNSLKRKGRQYQKVFHISKSKYM